MIKRFLSLFVILSILAISLSSLYLVIPNSFLSLDNHLRDFLFVLRGEIKTTGNVAIIDIDEKSLSEYGQWPWSRSITAELLEKLTQLDAGIIGLDMVFSESDATAIPKDINNSSNLCKHPSDFALAQVVASSPVIGGYFFSFDFKNTKAPSIPAVFIEKGLTSERYIPQPIGVKLNIDCIQNSLYSSGFFNTFFDEDGVVRSIPLIMRYDDMLYPSLALEMIRIYNNRDKVILQNSFTGAESITMGDLNIPIDRHGRMSLNFRGAGKHFDYISAVDVMKDRVDAKKVAGKFLLIGTSAIGLSDLRATPFDEVMAGVEIHANAIDALLAKDFIAIPQDEAFINIALICITILSTALLLYFVSGWLVIPIWIGSLYGLYLFFNYLLFGKGIILNIIFPLFAFFLSTIIILLMRFIFIKQLKQQFQEAFSRKVSPAVMNDIMTNETKNLLEPREKEVTIFFSDIRSFTSIYETIGSPTRLISLLNTYMIPMVENIISNYGTIDKFIGDSIMAYWNAPTDLLNHTDSAVTSALEQLTILKKLNIKIKDEYDITIDIGIGIHVGSVTIGEMGASSRSDYTIIGDSVNLASRLEGLCKHYGVRLIISQATKDALREDYILRELDLVSVKGKKNTTTIFEVIAKGKNIDEKLQDELEEYDKALLVYRKSKFIEAKRVFEVLYNRYNHHLYKMYQERCIILEKEHIKDFNGIFAFNTK
ncbi:MAG: adenylate/guanylate cyclase domain-containing protein [Sulfurovum sp.]